MSIGRWRNRLPEWTVALLVLVVLVLSISPASAQNKKKSWEIFLYFGEFADQKIPSAIQQGVVNTYRLDPYFAQGTPTNTDPNQMICPICRNLGQTGPGPSFLGPPDTQGNPTPVYACDPSTFPTRDPNAVNYYDECDDDMEARYKYNTQGITTNGEVQLHAREFLLGGRVGYDITRHWEVEMDLGFAKQRIDMTKNLIPILRQPVSNPADPWFQRLANFYEFTWANSDFFALGYSPVFDPNDPNIVASIGGIHEIPNVPQHRFSRNSAADIPAVLPMPLTNSETFQDVTDFVNRVLLNPTAFRNRANQINIDVFTVGLSGVYNFNTKPDSRIVPYLQAGAGQWMRSYDSPYQGQNTNYLNYGGGVRFFVNEIFSFRADFRRVMFQSDTMNISGTLARQNLLDVGSLGGCFRDQEPASEQPPAPCATTVIDLISRGQRASLRSLGVNPEAGGTARIDIQTKLDSFYEFRIGFDVLLGGK